LGAFSGSSSPQSSDEAADATKSAGDKGERRNGGFVSRHASVWEWEGAHKRDSTIDRDLINCYTGRVKEAKKAGESPFFFSFFTVRLQKNGRKQNKHKKKRVPTLSPLLEQVSLSHAASTTLVLPPQPTIRPRHKLRGRFIVFFSLILPPFGLKKPLFQSILGFMEVFRIQGGKQLSGTIPVYGLKNAATPIIAATLLSRERSVLENMPRIEDVFRMLEILESMGAIVEWIGERSVAITPGIFDPSKADQVKVKRLRSSILLLGALSARFDHFELRQPGGCVIGARPVDTHLEALKRLGIDIKGTEKGYSIDATKRRPGKVVLRQISVTATENAMLLAALLPGQTVIKVAACEPHVVDLANFLQKMGVEIHGAGTHTITICGKATLAGATHAIMPDHNEAATFLFLGVITGSELTVENAREDDLDIVLERLREFGVEFTITPHSITVHPPEKLKATLGQIDTRTYPGIPTETQSLFGTLATQAEGETLIFETMFEGRFNYATELEKMGGKLTILNPHQMLVQGPTPLRGTVIKSFDLRAGVALVIAALAATGETIIEDVYQVDRGYEKIEKRLSAIGASIIRETM